MIGWWIPVPGARIRRNRLGRTLEMGIRGRAIRPIPAVGRATMCALRILSLGTPHRGMLGLAILCRHKIRLCRQKMPGMPSAPQARQRRLVAGSVELSSGLVTKMGVGGNLARALGRAYARLEKSAVKIAGPSAVVGAAFVRTHASGWSAAVRMRTRDAWGVRRIVAMIIAVGGSSSTAAGPRPKRVTSSAWIWDAIMARPVAISAR